MIYFIILVALIFFGLILFSAFSKSVTTFEDTRLLELQEERDILISNLKEFNEEMNYEIVMREKIRLNKILIEIDKLLPSTSKKPQNINGITVTTIALIIILITISSNTIFPAWRYAGLPAQEASKLKNYTQLPILEAKAEKSKDISEYLAWGDAAWYAGEYKTAAKAYASVLLKDRENAKAMRRIGFFLLQDEKMAFQGFNFVRNSFEIDKNEPEGYLLYGYALGNFGKYKEALHYLKKYKEILPESNEADSLIIRFEEKTTQKIDGKLIFEKNCAACHGDNGEGKTAPSIITSQVAKNKTLLENKILNGGTAMPAFPNLKGRQINALTDYLKTIK